jgi:archaetidylinositol phosphate synthase
MPDTSTHKRVNDIFFGPLERPALAWLAAHMPAWVTSDLLTLIGFLSSILIFASYWLTQLDKNFLWLASFGFVLNWFGDSLDGTLARHRHLERPHYGFFIDHVIDAVSEVLIFLGIGLSPYVDFRLACLACITYLSVSVLVYVMTVTSGVFRISAGKFGPTEFRVIAILGNIFVYIVGNIKISLPFLSVSFYDLLIGIVIIILWILFTIVAVPEAIRLNKLDSQKKDS